MPRHNQPLREREEDILHAVYTYQYLTVDQVTRLFFSPRSQKSKSHAGDYLKRLIEGGFLYRFPLPSTCRGNRAYIYTPAGKGLKHLASLGFDLPSARREAKPPPSYQHIQHTLSLNDVLIAAALLPRSVDKVSLKTMLHEWMLKQRPLQVSVVDTAGAGAKHGDMNTLTVIPDAYLDFRLSLNGLSYQAAVWIELDRGTEWEKQFRRKVRGLYQASVSEAYQQEFAPLARYITIAFATTAGDKRQAQLRSWVKQELTLLQKTADADLLLITSLPPVDSLSPEQLFLSPVWLTCLSDTSVPLLDLA